MITKTMTPEEFRDYAKAFRDSDHWLPEMTDEVLDQVMAVLEATFIPEKERDYAETDSRIVVKLADGRIGVFTEWSDTSGHG